MTDIEAHITGTVWKIECAVGDTIEEGDTVAILESMKMEMPVEAEDAGTVDGDPLRGGPGGQRGRHAGRARELSPVRLPDRSRSSSLSPVPRAPPRELADGKLLVDEPADGVLRLTISNPAKRNALDHPILDAISATLEELSRGGLAARAA